MRGRQNSNCKVQLSLTSVTGFTLKTWLLPFQAAELRHQPFGYFVSTVLGAAPSAAPHTYSHVLRPLSLRFRPAFVCISNLFLYLSEALSACAHPLPPADAPGLAAAASPVPAAPWPSEPPGKRALKSELCSPNSKGLCICTSGRAPEAQVSRL